MSDLPAPPKWYNIDIDGQPKGRVKVNSALGRELAAFIDRAQDAQIFGAAYQFPSAYVEES